LASLKASLPWLYHPLISLVRTSKQIVIQSHITV
jgi:hypothetical protein